MLNDSRRIYGQNLNFRRYYLPRKNSFKPFVANSSLKAKTETTPKRFTQVIRGLDTVYPEKALADISTSFCFICLLHLANEKGLKIEGNNTLDELSIVRDITVEGTDSF